MYIRKPGGVDHFQEEIELDKVLPSGARRRPFKLVRNEQIGIHYLEVIGHVEKGGYPGIGV